MLLNIQAHPGYVGNSEGTVPVLWRVSNVHYPKRVCYALRRSHNFQYLGQNEECGDRLLPEREALV